MITFKYTSTIIVPGNEALIDDVTADAIADITSDEAFTLIENNSSEYSEEGTSLTYGNGRHDGFGEDSSYSTYLTVDLTFAYDDETEDADEELFKDICTEAINTAMDKYAPKGMFNSAEFKTESVSVEINVTESFKSYINPADLLTESTELAKDFAEAIVSDVTTNFDADISTEVVESEEDIIVNLMFDGETYSVVITDSEDSINAVNIYVVDSAGNTVMDEHTYDFVSTSVAVDEIVDAINNTVESDDADTAKDNLAEPVQAEMTEGLKNFAKSVALAAGIAGAGMATRLRR